MRTTTPAWTPFLLAGITLAGPALALDGGADPQSAVESLAFMPAELSYAAALREPSRHPFATKGAHQISFGGGLAHSLRGDADDFNGTFSYTYFLADQFEVTGELGAWYFYQHGDDAQGLNPCFVMRYHWWVSEDRRWSAYADAGIGALFATDNVPDRGTSFDVTPRFGAGITRQINDEGWRLQLGVRWAHVSNARILGDASNPSRDGIMGYFAIVIPF